MTSWQTPWLLWRVSQLLPLFCVCLLLVLVLMMVCWQDSSLFREMDVVVPTKDHATRRLSTVIASPREQCKECQFF